MSRELLASNRAAQWIIAQEDDQLGEADRAEFDAWMAESDGNKAAYWRLKHAWREADRIGTLGRGAIGHGHSPKADRMARQWVLGVGTAASILGLVGVCSIALHSPSGPASTNPMAEYATPVGGRRTIGFSDGTRVQLNTASRVRAAMTQGRREVWLDKGEAYFEVAHDAGRPFIVHAGSQQITVLGTKFSVRRDGNKVIVAVVEGRVRVGQLGGDQVVRQSTIEGGDMALAQGNATLVMARSADRVADVLAWRVGMLTFDRTSLSEAAAEFNRYNVRQLIVTDREAGDIRIGGMFPAAEPQAFARLLRDAYGLTAVEAPTSIKISTEGTSGQTRRTSTADRE